MQNERHKVMRYTQQQKHNYGLKLVQMIEATKPRFYVTFAFNDDRYRNKATDKLAGFFAHMNRKIAGARWQKKPMQKLLHGAIIFEHLNSNLHAHALLNGPTYVHLNDLQKNAERVWEKITKSGDVLVEDIENVQARSWYNMKERFQTKFDEQVIWTNMLGEVELQIDW